MTQILDPPRLDADTPNEVSVVKRRRWPKVIAVAIAAFLLLGAGVAVGGADHTKLDAANKATATFQGKLATAQSQLASLSGQLSALQGQQASIQAGVDAAKAANDSAKAVDKTVNDAAKAANDQAKATNDQRAQQLDAQAAALTAQTAAANASSFSDGLYQVGADIKAGRYHTGGGTNCYWATLRSSDTSNIADNANNNGPQTVVIDSAYFQTSNCGTWAKVG